MIVGVFPQANRRESGAGNASGAGAGLCAVAVQLPG